MPERLPILIVGGGIAGLSAAYTLQQEGVPFHLYEGDDRWGGVIRSERVAGFLLEAGPDAILAQKPEGIALCRELGLGERLVPTNPHQRTVFIVRGGRAHRMPDGLVLTIPTRVLPFARASLFTWRGKLRMGMEAFVPARRDGQDESISSFMLRRFGREALDLLGDPLLAGIHSGDPARLSILATFPRFVEMERRYGSLIRGMLAARRPTSASRGHAFYSLQGGLSELVTALVGKLPPASLHASSPVDACHPVSDGYELTLRSGDRVRGGSLILALPGHRASPLLDHVDAQAAAIMGAVPFASTAVVFLGYRRDQVRHPLDGYGLMASRREGWRTAAMSFFSTKYPGRAPDGHVLLRGFLGGARDPSILDLTDSDLVHQVQRDAQGLLGLTGEPVLTKVYRWPLGTPQMEVGHLAAVGRLDERIARCPGLYLTGAGLRTTGIPDGVGDAATVARDAARYWRAHP